MLSTSLYQLGFQHENLYPNLEIQYPAVSVGYIILHIWWLLWISFLCYFLILQASVVNAGRRDYLIPWYLILNIFFLNTWSKTCCFNPILCYLHLVKLKQGNYISIASKMLARKHLKYVRMGGKDSIYFEQNKASDLRWVGGGNIQML